jgi:hypothetical protein
MVDATPFLPVCHRFRARPWSPALMAVGCPRRADCAERLRALWGRACIPVGGEVASQAGIGGAPLSFLARGIAKLTS